MNSQKRVRANADRDRRLEAERAALIEREAAESSNEDGRSRMGGFRGGPFRGFGSNVRILPVTLYI